jgi:hypothetical protein
MLLATGMHVSYGHKHDLTMDETTPTAYEPILSRTTTTTTTTTTINTSLSAEDESTPLIVRSEQPVDSGKILFLKNVFFNYFELLIVAQKLISCCSLINNYHILKYESQPKNLACLNGIRVLSFWWIILGHTFLFASYYSGKFSLISIN